MISVIVPVYNVDQYLCKCIDSIKKQTYSNLEIILVDDGSTDKSGQLCDELAKSDSRIRVVHKKNGGLSDARNAGIEIASGEYLGFVDADDYIDLNMYESMISLLQKYKADIAVCGINYVTDGKVQKISCLDEVKEYNTNDALSTYFLTNEINASACNKLFSTRLFECVRFPFGKKYEDIAVMHLLLEKANKIVHCGEAFYYYLNRAGSITKVNFSRKDVDLISIRKEINNYYTLDSEYHLLSEKALAEAYLVTLNKLILYNCEKEYRDIYNECKQSLKSMNRQLARNPFFSNKERLKLGLVVYISPVYKIIIHVINR